jgi:hypothetical protein
MSSTARRLARVRNEKEEKNEKRKETFEVPQEPVPHARVERKR